MSRTFPNHTNLTYTIHSDANTVGFLTSAASRSYGRIGVLFKQLGKNIECNEQDILGLISIEWLSRQSTASSTSQISALQVAFYPFEQACILTKTWGKDAVKVQGNRDSTGPMLKDMHTHAHDSPKQLANTCLATYWSVQSLFVHIFVYSCV